MDAPGVAKFASLVKYLSSGKPWTCNAHYAFMLKFMQHVGDSGRNGNTCWDIANLE